MEHQANLVGFSFGRTISLHCNFTLRGLMLMVYVSQICLSAFDVPQNVPTLVCWYYPSVFADTAFLFAREQVEEGYARLCVGMGNACCVRYKFEFENNLLSSVVGFKLFPDKPRAAFSRIGWQLVCKVARNMQLSLGKSWIGDSPSSSFKFDISDCEWAYLSFCLA